MSLSDEIDINRIDLPKPPKWTIKSLYNRESDFYKIYEINTDNEEINTLKKQLKNIDKFFCKNFTEYTQNTTRDSEFEDIYAIIFKAIDNIKILINLLDNFFDKQKNKDILELAINDYKSFYKLLRLLQITSFNSTSCSSKIVNFNSITISTYKEEFLKFVFTIISDELLYCTILTKLHLPFVIYKNSDTTTKELIANNFNDVVCFKSTAGPDSYPYLSTLFSYGNKLPEYDDLDFINYRYNLTSTHHIIEAAALDNVIILKNNSLTIEYFVNVVTMDTLDISINNNFEFVNEDINKYMEYSKNKSKNESKNESFNDGDILLYTIVIFNNNDPRIFEFSKIDYDIKYETISKSISFNDLFIDNDIKKCKENKVALNKLSEKSDISKILYVVLRKFLWTLDNSYDTINKSIIYSNNFYLEKKNPVNIFKKIKHINKKIKHINRGDDTISDDTISIGDFYNNTKRQVLRIPKSNIPIKHDYAPSFNKQKRIISNKQYLNSDGTEIPTQNDDNKTKANKKIDVSELITCEIENDEIVNKEQYIKYFKYFKYPSNDKIMYEVYKNYHFYNEIKLNKYNDIYSIEEEKKIVNKYKPYICNYTEEEEEKEEEKDEEEKKDEEKEEEKDEEEEEEEEEKEEEKEEEEETKYKDNITKLLKRDAKEIKNLIDNKQGENNIMKELQKTFKTSIEKKYEKTGVGKRQGRVFEALDIGRDIGSRIGSRILSGIRGQSGGDTRKNKINKKDNTIKNYLKEKTQYNKKSKFINNKPLNIKITIKNN